LLTKAQIFRFSNPIKAAIIGVLAAKLLVLVIGIIVTYFNTSPASPATLLENLFNRWDAPNYVDIAQNGYVSSGSQANFIVFFPLYPLLIKAFTFDYTYANITALTVANACSLIAYLYLYKLAKLEFNQGVALKAVLLLCIFPTAYFLSAPYTEGLFFALVIACFYYARVSRWAVAGTLSFLASLTRLAGLLLLPMLLVEYYHQLGWKPKKTRVDLALVFLGLAGFLVYLYINVLVTGNALTFISFEAEHWSNRLDPRAGANAAYYFAGNGEFPSNITIGAAPIAFAVFGAAMIGASIWKRMRSSYTVYMTLMWALAVSTSWWISVPRYIMAMFPMFMLLGTIKSKAALIGIAVFSVAWLCFFTVLFALGWWAF
jgi:hypothetical protein